MILQIEKDRRWNMEALFNGNIVFIFFFSMIAIFNYSELKEIFVKEEYGTCGYAKELLLVCENWAKKQECTEYASDCELSNKGSFDFHMSMGFEEGNRVICFTKRL